MRKLSKVSRLARAVCAGSASAFLVFGSVGCGGSSGPATGTKSELPPEIKKANEDMENFMKNQPKK